MGQMSGLWGMWSVNDHDRHSMLIRATNGRIDFRTFAICETLKPKHYGNNHSIDVQLNHGPSSKLVKKDCMVIAVFFIFRRLTTLISCCVCWRHVITMHVTASRGEQGKVWSDVFVLGGSCASIVTIIVLVAVCVVRKRRGSERRRMEDSRVPVHDNSQPFPSLEYDRLYYQGSPDNKKQSPSPLYDHVGCHEKRQGARV